MISALPAALAGIAWLLFITHTTLSVPALLYYTPFDSSEINETKHAWVRRALRRAGLGTDNRYIWRSRSLWLSLSWRRESGRA
jgi:hypothetical protein